MRVPSFLIRLLHKLRCLPLLNLYSAIRLERKRILIPVLGGQGYSNFNLSEPWMTETLKCLRPVFNGHFVDVGVNLGQTLIKACAIFEEIQYLGFEPNPSCVHYVQELIRINKLKGYDIFPIGVAAKTEVLKLIFFEADESDSSATIIEHYRPLNREDHFIYVPVFDFHSISSFLPENPYSLVKIDVEGAELDVLLGLQDWIKANQPYLLVEILPVYSSENQARLKRQEEIESLFRNWGYKMARLKKTIPASIEEIRTIGVHSSIVDCDYLIYPASLAGKIHNCFSIINPGTGQS
jgi:FkbM family methyltransferase